MNGEREDVTHLLKNGLTQETYADLQDVFLSLTTDE